MLNPGIRSSAKKFPFFVPTTDETPSDERIAEMMFLPEKGSVEELLIEELEAVRHLLGEWSHHTSLDMLRLFFRNTVCKKALYISSPILLPDTLHQSVFLRKGTNTRLHLYLSPDIEHSVRLEAISTHAIGPYRFRYALSVQYTRDSLDRPWQLLRPVILADSNILRRIGRFPQDRGHKLPRLLELLRRIILVGAHDYVHGTLLNWFQPPPLECPASYLALISEGRHPPELDQWHEESVAPWPAEFGSQAFRRDVVPLELFSLIVHADVTRCIMDRHPHVETKIYTLIRDFFIELDHMATFGGVQFDQQVDRYLSTIACWFLVCVGPIGTPEVTRALSAPDCWGRPRHDVAEILSQLNGERLALVQTTRRAAFPWGGELIDVNEVARRYHQALKIPALRAHLSYLLGSTGSDSGQELDYLGMICGPSPEDWCRGLRERLQQVRAHARPQTIQRLANSVDLDQLSNDLNRLSERVCVLPERIFTQYHTSRRYTQEHLDSLLEIIATEGPSHC